MTRFKGRTERVFLRLTPELHRRVTRASGGGGFVNEWVHGVLTQFLDERGIWPEGESPPEPEQRKEGEL